MKQYDVALYKLRELLSFFAAFWVVQVNQCTSVHRIRKERHNIQYSREVELNEY